MEKFSPAGGAVIATPSVTKEIVRELQLPIKKSWGQNFLVDPSAVKKIVSAADIKPSELIFEVGPGIGALSQFLAQEDVSLALVEIDPMLAHHLSAYFADAPQVRVLNQDALLLDFAACAREMGFARYKVVANLPYYITTPLLMHFLEQGGAWETMVLMMQKEVAQRLAALPGSKECGALSLSVQYRAKVEKICTISPAAFMPRPEVDSTVVLLERLATPPVAVDDEKLLFTIIKAAFAQRRKTLLNALAGGACLGDKAFWQERCRLAEIDSGRRGETLSLAEFARLANSAGA